MIETTHFMHTISEKIVNRNQLYQKSTQEVCQSIMFVFEALAEFSNTPSGSFVLDEMDIEEDILTMIIGIKKETDNDITARLSVKIPLVIVASQSKEKVLVFLQYLDKIQLPTKHEAAVKFVENLIREYVAEDPQPKKTPTLH